jgi:hypothetical protein
MFAPDETKAASRRRRVYDNDTGEADPCSSGGRELWMLTDEYGD